MSLYDTRIPLRRFAFQLSFPFVQGPAFLKCFPSLSPQTSSGHCLRSFVQEERRRSLGGPRARRESACQLRSGTCVPGHVLSREAFPGRSSRSPGTPCVFPFVSGPTRKFFSKFYVALHQRGPSSAPSVLCILASRG